MGDALHTHGGVTSAQEARLADAGLLAVQGPTPLDVRTGVLHGPGTVQLVTGTSSTAPMRVAVSAHQWVTSRGAAYGPYRGSLDAVALPAIAAAPASGSRVDVVYVKQQDSTPGVPTPDATTAPLYGVVQGVSTTGTPAKPALPVGAEELATVRVAAGATRTDGAGITITNSARQTVARGARVPVRDQADRDALTRVPGLEVYRLDTGDIELCPSASGTTWLTVYDASSPRDRIITRPAVITAGSAAYTIIAGGAAETGLTTGAAALANFTLGRPCTVMVRGDFRAGGSAAAQCTVKIDGAQVGVVPGVTRSDITCHTGGAVALAAGSHTISLRVDSIGTTGQSVTWTSAQVVLTEGSGE